MQNLTERDKHYLARLTDFLLREYGFAVISIKPAKRGYYGETWRLDTVSGSYFIKIVFSKAHKVFYERSFPVVDRINSAHIDCVSKIIKTLDGRLYTDFNDGIVGVFDWIDGENVQDEHTKISEYNILAHIYTIPFDGLNIPRENFRTQSAVLFYQQWDMLGALKQSETANKLLKLFKKHATDFERLFFRLRWFSERCKKDKTHFYITHGDAGGNVIVNAEKSYIVDWDDPVIAPPEWDAWFCLHWDWAMSGFDSALCKNEIDYFLRPERLAYYCYHSFFWYMTKYMETFFENGGTSSELADEIENYLENSWILENIKYADTIE